MEQAGLRCLALQGDVAEERFCEKLVSRVFETFGRLDIVALLRLRRRSCGCDDLTIFEQPEG